MKKALAVPAAVIFLSLFLFSLSFGYFENAATPELDYISNMFELLWDGSKAEVLRMMTIFPHYECTDYGDQISCVSIYNRENGSIYLNFFLDDYEEHHDNLWKVSVTADIGEPNQFQEVFHLLWLQGMKPAHSKNDEVFTYKGVQPLCFENEKTRLTAYFQPFDAENNPFFLVEYYGGSGR